MKFKGMNMNPKTEWAGMTNGVERKEGGEEMAGCRQSKGLGKHNESAGEWEKEDWRQVRYQTGRNDQWDTSWIRKRGRPTTERAGMTNWVEVRGKISAKEVTGGGNQMACE